MGNIAAYSLSSGIFLLAGYLAYKWLLSTEKQPGLNRILLLVIYFAAIVLPLLPAIDLVSHHGAGRMVEITVGQLQGHIIEASSTPRWISAILWIYMTGVAAMLLFIIGAFIRLLWIIRGGRRIKSDSYTLILLADSHLAPFSWLRYIVMPLQDYNESGSTILTHEQAHLRLGHWADLLMADAVCALMWYNPASWLMRRELRNIHEYQADRAVLRAGADARQYQMLLIKKAAGQRFPSLANSLNHSKLKKRITMMCTNSTRGSRRLRALVLGPAMLAALAVVNIPAVASALTNVSNVPLSESSAIATGKVTKISLDSQTPAAASVAAETGDTGDRMPQFPGGEQALYRFMGMELKYPADAMKAGHEGRVVVGFTVEADGKVSNPEIVVGVCESLDREALRIVSSMPNWTPGYSDGKAVACSYVIPVEFKLESSGKSTTPESADVNIRKTHKPDDAVVETKVVVDGQTYTAKNTSVFVDGHKYNASLDDIAPNTIESIIIIKDDPAFPEGRIDIKLKK